MHACNGFSLLYHVYYVSFSMNTLYVGMHFESCTGEAKSALQRQLKECKYCKFNVVWYYENIKDCNDKKYTFMSLV